MYTWQNIRRRTRRYGYEVTAELLRDGVVIEGLRHVFQRDPTDEEIISGIKGIITSREAEEAEAVNRDTLLADVGPEVLEALKWLVTQIRKYPNATYAQATPAWNAAWAGSLFTFDKLAAYVIKRVGNITWEQFKTYVSTHKINGIDY